MLAPALLQRASQEAFDIVAKTLSLESWPAVPIRWNRRLTRAGRALIDMPRGRFERASIELSPRYFEVYPDDLFGILVHEAVHVGLAIQGRPFGHGPDFREACARAGGLQHSRWLPGRVYRYRCPICNDQVERRRPAASSRWCADCAAEAETGGIDPFAPERALILVKTVFQGREPPSAQPD